MFAPYSFGAQPKFALKRAFKRLQLGREALIR